MTTATATERPILFSERMVRAILYGQKTQTRRVMKPQPATDDFAHFSKDLSYPASIGKLWAGFWLSPETKKVSEESGGKMGSPGYYACPYGMVGERLWVRETWQHEDGSCDDHKCGQPTHIYHKATETFPESMRWRPSIFMPRWACRLVLEIENVRVERLNQMSHHDWVKDFAPSGAEINQALETFNGMDNQREMARIFWDSINAKRGYSWASNPWVWVIEFKVVL